MFSAADASLHRMSLHQAHQNTLLEPEQNQITSGSQEGSQTYIMGKIEPTPQEPI